jgi:hypothetical protein
MADSNFLEAIRKEYTIQLINMLTPSIYEGINSIYLEVKNIAKDGEELKMFQGFLAKIPTWTENIIADEASRIKRVNEKNADIIDDLIRAVIQSNILLLTSTNLADKQRVLKEFNINLNYEKFIHNIYIEVAKIFYNYPFLFYHKMNALEYKKNQLKAHKLIKEAIEEAIRKMLPLQLILKKYLGSMSEINDDKYIRSLVHTENNNKQYGLSNKQSNSESNSSEIKTNRDNNNRDNNNNNINQDNNINIATGQFGGIVQSQPPMSLKEIYEQQKEAEKEGGVISPSVKPMTIPATDIKNNQPRSEHKKSEKINILIPNNLQKQHKNNMSESSQPYYKQGGGIEEEFSNADKNNKRSSAYKPSLNAVQESANSVSNSDASKKVYNFRGY